jgi:hypothetical protein
MGRKLHNNQPPYALEPRHSIRKSGSLPLRQPSWCLFNSVGSADSEQLLGNGLDYWEIVVRFTAEADIVLVM